MIMKNIYTVYFSPTGGTKKVATTLSDNLSQHLHTPSQSIDLTLPADRQISYDFDSDSLVILATDGFGKMFAWERENRNHPSQCLWQSKL